MLTTADKKLLAYTSVLTGILVNIFKLLSLRENAVLPHYWKFNFYEFLFQVFWNFLFCFITGWITFKIEKKKFPNSIFKTLTFLFSYVICFLFALAAGIGLQKKIFNDVTPDRLFKMLYFFRLLISLALEILFIRIFWLLQEKKLKEQENQQLKSAYLTAQLELLKQQLNPHFLFNTLSSLSAIVREDQKKAQQYILDLSKIFRYALQQEETSLVTVEEELSVLHSYVELLKMRFEENLNVMIDIQHQYLKLKLPHMSLQPLIENAVKHNSAGKTNTLNVNITCDAIGLRVKNNIQPLKIKEQSTGIGLTNLNERFKILTGKAISIFKDDKQFSIILPLI